MIADGRWRTRVDVAATRYQQLAQRRPVLGLPLTFLDRYTARQGMLLASACAFRLFLWLLPLALLLAGVLAGLAGLSTDQHTIESATRTAGVAGAASQEIATALTDGHRSWWVAVVIGGVLFLATTRTLLRSLALVSAHAWQVPVPRPQQREVLRTTVVFAACGLALLVSADLVARIDQWFSAGVVLATAVQTLVAAGLWLVVSRRLPNDARMWTDLVPGCPIFGLGIAVLHAVSRVYLPSRLRSSSQLYGALGVAAVILGWMLVIGEIIVAAALANSVWSDHRVLRGGGAAGADGLPAGGDDDRADQ